MAQKKDRIKRALVMVMSLLAGVAIGVLMVIYMENHIPAGLRTGQELLWIWIMLLSFYGAIFLQIVVHESGHLLFGLASGYRFVSFRIASLQWTKIGGKLRFSRHSIAGTAGQCLMAPPAMVDGKYPVMLYNLGGSLVNLLSTFLFSLLYIFTAQGQPLGFFWLSMAVVGLLFALSNGIPMRLGTVDNDGYNALSLGKNPEAMRGLWLQLMINAEMAAGKRLKEMPDEWFTVPSDEAMSNSLVAAVGSAACSRLLDQGRYSDADALMERLLNGKNGMTGLHRSMMICDRVCCEMLGKNRRNIVDGMYTEALQSFMRSMKNNPSVIRTQYLHALLAEGDTAKGAQLLSKFDKVAKTYPYPNDMLADREMIATAQYKLESEANSHG